jgi:hypothetical protein
MMQRFLKVFALPLEGFFRAGEFWPHEGRVIDVETLGAGVLERLASERMLRIEPAPEGVTAEDAAQADHGLRDRVRTAIALLPAEAFGASGAPNLTPLREALPADAGQITGALRDEV